MELSNPQIKIVRRLKDDGVFEEKGKMVWGSSREKLDTHATKLLVRLEKRDLIQRQPAHADGRIFFTSVLG